jgi:hypothetical protein
LRTHFGLHSALQLSPRGFVMPQPIHCPASLHRGGHTGGVAALDVLDESDAASPFVAAPSGSVVAGDPFSDGDFEPLAPFAGAPAHATKRPTTGSRAKKVLARDMVPRS